jgi:hypothetical protein
MDDVNALRLSRLLQFNLHFFTGYEAYLLSRLIEALDNIAADPGGNNGSRNDLDHILQDAFRNRNVSRSLVQALGPRHDWFYHWGTAVTWNRSFDALGQIPVVGAITRFPATENFPSTRDHALASIFRVVLGEGNWITRVVTRGREGLVTDSPDAVAQNLAAESNGFELANRNQYGTHFGRVKTNEFRSAHRLPTDESLVRTFVARPMPTMTNNGVVHTLRALAKHWNNMLYQEWGNFAHQRMEQLDPFETLRFHLPEVLLVLSSLRGRNRWDAQVLGPMIHKLQNLKPGSTAKDVRLLVAELREDIVIPVCGGVATICDPFQSWLDAIQRSLVEIEKEAKKIYKLVSSVELGIRLGHDIMEQVSWKVPSGAVLGHAIQNYIRGESVDGVSEQRICSALQLTTPRDKRTLISLVQEKLGHTKAENLLLARVKTLLQRELRREMLNETILEMSKGDVVLDNDLVLGDWYWLEDRRKSGIYRYEGETEDERKHLFVHINSDSKRILSLQSLEVRHYVPVAETICRAQKMLMTIELDHGKKFSYNAFMAFALLRVALRRLAVVSQMACEVLDNARLNILEEIKRSKEKEPKSQNGRMPQSLLVVGGGPAGLTTTLHCAENVLLSGGVVKLFEARDSFAKGGSSYERAQIVRLDARWIVMLRYHLGTGFEDVFVPASGETDSQLGNNL